MCQQNRPFICWSLSLHMNEIALEAIASLERNDLFVIVGRDCRGGTCPYPCPYWLFFSMLLYHSCVARFSMLPRLRLPQTNISRGKSSRIFALMSRCASSIGGIPFPEQRSGFQRT